MTDKMNNKTQNATNYEKAMEEFKGKYADLMAEDPVKNAIKFNRQINKKVQNLGIKTVKYQPKEDKDGNC